MRKVAFVRLTPEQRTELTERTQYDWPSWRGVLCPSK
jgi:hypothetical protein